eukprot:1699609-Amphidinium_carterae.1
MFFALSANWKDCQGASRLLVCCGLSEYCDVAEVFYLGKRIAPTASCPYPHTSRDWKSRS